MNVPPTVLLRPATLADADCIAVLAMQVFLDTYATDGIRGDLAREALGVYSPAAFGQRLREPGRGILLAERAGHLVGFAEWQQPADCFPVPLVDLVPQDAPAPQAELVRLYVQRPAQGQGTGRALLGAVAAQVAQAGARSLWLTAWAGNTRARDFYAGLGFRDMGTTTYAIEGQAYENRVLLLPLDAPAVSA